jgi:glutaryl-CoA dehydrogenase
VTSSTDFFLADRLLTDGERNLRDQVRAFAEQHLRPVARDAWERGEFPGHLLPRLAELGIAGGLFDERGHQRISSVGFGLAMQELARVDSSFATFVTVQAGLVPVTLITCGSPEQRERWLPRLARCETIGAFALTEPEHGSDAAALSTTARREGNAYILDGAKRWIGNVSIGHLVIVWARAEDGVAGFLIELPADGLRATPIAGKLAQRSVPQVELVLDGCRVPAENRLPTGGFRAVSNVLAQTRYNVAWHALGEAIACYEAALSYAKQRQQFGKPIAAFQLVQAKLVHMLGEITKNQLLLVQLGRLKDAGAMTPGMSALGKRSATAMARSVAMAAREVLGGNGILHDFDVMRHLCDLEAVYTYEGTYDINTLIVGREITGLSAFS